MDFISDQNSLFLTAALSDVFVVNCPTLGIFAFLSLLNRKGSAKEFRFLPPPAPLPPKIRCVFIGVKFIRVVVITQVCVLAHL